MDLKPTGTKKNHKKGIAGRLKVLKREQAEERNARYQGMNVDQQMERNSAKVKRKLAAKWAVQPAGGK